MYSGRKHASYGRKYIASNWVRIIIWLAYLAADWIAAVCIGVLSNENGDDNLSQPNSLIWAFWAPFLLLHLGGPDTITAYSLEDNELWLRHFLALVIQFGGTFYIFLRSWKAKLLNILAIPIFVAGLIKYGERTWVLRSASSEQFRDALLPRPDPGPNYPKFMDEYTSGKAEGYQVSIQQRGKTSRTVHSPPEGDILRQAYYFFETFKGLFADIILSSQRRKRSQSFFQGKHKQQAWEEVPLEVALKVAFEVVEIELGFMYDVLYTKATVTCSRWGSLLRSISLSFTISAFIAFLTIDRQEYSTIDIGLSGGQVKTKTKTQRATDLCYENDAEKNPDCKACKVLSDYMLYLLVMCPFMLPDGIGEIRYRDSCAEAKEFFKDRKHIKSRTQACKDLLRVSTEFPASQVKGDRSKSLLFDACRLAKSLQSREHKWELMRGVWVEMLCYAASQCRPNQHAKQLRRGGELLTHVWLLMAHLDHPQELHSSPFLSSLEIWVSPKLTSLKVASLTCLKALKLLGVKEELLPGMFITASSLESLSIAVVDDMRTLPDELLPTCFHPPNSQHLELPQFYSIPTLDRQILLTQNA
ncbi:hypothetical protein CK203_035040 [Vitis vinifera]|uniref:DUF4220 domain-containing protein n=1 Tax=Vitis vinifera TaxID=29760 RepID=A0A438I9Z2_VITVI|nr:hypothetical protein CK203_035040 [Vitis vinifera]